MELKLLYPQDLSRSCREREREIRSRGMEKKPRKVRGKENERHVEWKHREERGLNRTQRRKPKLTHALTIHPSHTFYLLIF